MKNKNIILTVSEWFTPIFDAATQEAVLKLIEFSPNDLADSFYKNLEFGTGGMRGLVGVGTNRINKYTIGKSTQGLADYLYATFPNQPLKTVIAYDCRLNSKMLAKVVADVFSANGIQVYLFSDLRPTPELSFALTYLSCHCGIVLTASHNPPEYNGYKVYWRDGGQIVPPDDARIINAIEKLNYDQIKFKTNEKLIQYINKDIDRAFIKSAIENATFNTPSGAKENLKIIFTSLHGTSITVIPDTLLQAGYSALHIVEKQKVPDRDYPSIKISNPEQPEALAVALAVAEKTQADIVIGTDPDCSRFAVAIRNNEGQMILLNGNQTMILMTAFLLDKWKKAGKINGKQFVASTIVSTPMIVNLAAAFGVECKLSLTGFKWITKMVKDFPELEFIGGGEESHSYMVGDIVRDKDAVTATLLICEMASLAKAKGRSVFRDLVELYIKYGFYKEHFVSITKKGKEGLAEIKQIMVNLRKRPLLEINSKRVICIEDYQSLLAKHIVTGKTTPIFMPQSDVLIYYTEDGSKICVRPSGTEPKIKFYISVNKSLDSIENFKNTESDLNEMINNISNAMKLHKRFAFF